MLVIGQYFSKIKAFLHIDLNFKQSRPAHYILVSAQLWPMRTGPALSRNWRRPQFHSFGFLESRGNDCNNGFFGVVIGVHPDLRFRCTYWNKDRVIELDPNTKVSDHNGRWRGCRQDFVCITPRRAHGSDSAAGRKEQKTYFVRNRNERAVIGYLHIHCRRQVFSAVSNIEKQLLFAVDTVQKGPCTDEKRDFVLWKYSASQCFASFRLVMWDHNSSLIRK